MLPPPILCFTYEGPWRPYATDPSIIYPRAQSSNAQIAPKLVEIACDKKGTHALQALVSLVNCAEEEELIISTIKNNILVLTLVHSPAVLLRSIGYLCRFMPSSELLSLYCLAP